MEERNIPFSSTSSNRVVLVDDTISHKKAEKVTSPEATGSSGALKRKAAELDDDSSSKQTDKDKETKQRVTLPGFWKDDKAGCHHEECQSCPCFPEGDEDEHQNEVGDCNNLCADHKECKHNDRKVKLWLWLDEEVSPLSFVDYKVLSKAKTVSPQVAQRFLNNFLPEDCVSLSGKPFLQQLKLAVTSYLTNPEDREIIVRCTFKDTEEGNWIYNTNSVVDLLPYIVPLLPKSFHRRAAKLLHPAPQIGEFIAYPSFCARRDTLFLEYRRCGATEEECIKYLDNIASAVDNIAKAELNIPKEKKVKRIKVTYCPQMISMDECTTIIGFLEKFKQLSGLKHLHLIEHNDHDKQVGNSFYACFPKNAKNHTLLKQHRDEILSKHWKFKIHHPCEDWSDSEHSATDSDYDYDMASDDDGPKVPMDAREKRLKYMRGPVEDWQIG